MTLLRLENGAGPRRLAWVLLAYGILGLALWPIPLFNILHAESAAVVTGVAFFVAGLSSVGLFRRQASFRSVLFWQVAALALPWLLLTVTLARAPNCGYGQGLLIFLLFAPPSVALAVAMAYAIVPRRRAASLFALLAVAIALVGVALDLGFHPQFYVYNHVFGGLLGPIYDEELILRQGLFFSRGLTLLWAFLAFLIGLLRRGRLARRVWVALPAMAIGLCYLFGGALGIRTTHRVLAEALGGHLQTAHFDIYYAPATLGPREARRVAEDHEFRYAQLSHALETEVEGRIASYLYPDADTKARLTGARTTNVAPTWLARPQVHVLAPAYAQVFPHELAHVFSRSFGLPLIRASWSIGLVEGLAVALEPPRGLPTPHEQVAARAMLQLREGASPGLAADLAGRLSPVGFWTGRGAVSYTMLGSFVRYLLDAYGAARLRSVYPR